MSTQYEERQRLTPAYPRFSLAEVQVGFMEALYATVVGRVLIFEF